MNNKGSNEFPPPSNIKQPSNESQDYPSLSQLGLQESVGDMQYTAEGSKIKDKKLPKDLNYYLDNNSSNSMYDEKYNSNQINNKIPPPQPVQGQQKYYNINKVDNNSKYVEGYDSNPNQNKNNIHYPQKIPPNQNIKYDNNSSCSYNSNDIKKMPPGYAPHAINPNVKVPLGYPMPVPPGIPVPRVVGHYIVPPEEMEPVYQLRPPGIYPHPYPTVIPDFYPY